eukprot:356793_1
MSSVETPNNDTRDVLSVDTIPMKQLLQSIASHQMLLSFGYIRENALNIPTSITRYIAIFAFYGPLYEYESDFDTNGIVYAIATHYGQTQWTNPAKQRLITIQSSGWTLGNVEDVLARPHVEGGCKTDYTPNAWLSFDFGAATKIKASHYTLRHHGGRGLALRNWNFEASNDGTNWKALRQHENDTHLYEFYDTHTWAIDANEYYQMFRIFMTGKDSGSCWFLSCGGFEIYGHLIDSW